LAGREFGDNQEENKKVDGIVKSRHSRENGNPENFNYLKILDSGWSLPRT